MFQKKTCLTSWWLNHPVIKICNPQNGWRSSPSILRGENSKHIWMKPPPCGCQPKSRGDWYPQNGWCINFMVQTLWTNGMIWGAKPPIFGNHHPDLNLFFFLLLSKHVLCLVPHVSATGVTRSHPKINLEISKTSRFTRLCSKKTMIHRLFSHNLHKYGSKAQNQMAKIGKKKTVLTTSDKGAKVSAVSVWNHRWLLSCTLICFKYALAFCVSFCAFQWRYSWVHRRNSQLW